MNDTTHLGQDDFLIEKKPTKSPIIETFGKILKAAGVTNYMILFVDKDGSHFVGDIKGNKDKVCLFADVFINEQAPQFRVDKNKGNE